MRMDSVHEPRCHEPAARYAAASKRLVLVVQQEALLAPYVRVRSSGVRRRWPRPTYLYRVLVRGSKSHTMALQALGACPHSCHTRMRLRKSEKLSQDLKVLTLLAKKQTGCKTYAFRTPRPSRSPGKSRRYLDFRSLDSRKDLGNYLSKQLRIRHFLANYTYFTLIFF